MHTNFHSIHPAFCLLVLLAAGSLSGCEVRGQQNAGTAAIRLNQVGYFTNGEKKAAVIGAASDEFYLISGEEVVYRGALEEEKYWENSGEQVRIADFSPYRTPGAYYLRTKNSEPVPVYIAEAPFVELSRAAVKAFYFNRMSTDLPEKYAGKYAREAGHPDDRVIVHASAASAGRPAGTIISTPYGWYDAGDYNKYVVNSGISTFTLLTAYEQHRDYYDTLDLNIPESANSIPDILDEAYWNLRWMMTMQDPGDGGVYNKTTTAQFEAFVQPKQATAPRYVVAKGTAAALNFAAVMAKASRIYRPYDAAFSKEALKRADAALKWASAHPDVPFLNPGPEGDFPGITTGGYGDRRFTDEFEWAAIEMYLVTGKGHYLDDAAVRLTEGEYKAPSWPDVRTLGLISLLAAGDRNQWLQDQAGQRLLALADDFVKEAEQSPYRITIDRFFWGSNAEVANKGMVLMTAFYTSGDQKYFDTALACLDYLLGRNATGYCFVTGFGRKYPMHIHHRPSASDSIAEPVPGWLVGGPNPRNVDDDCGAGQYPSTLPAKCYADLECSYSTNEVAINWNAPFAYLTAALQYGYLKDSLHKP